MSEETKHTDSMTTKRILIYLGITFLITYLFELPIVRRLRRKQ